MVIHIHVYRWNFLYFVSIFSDPNEIVHVRVSYWGMSNQSAVFAVGLPITGLQHLAHACVAPLAD